METESLLADNISPLCDGSKPLLADYVQVEGQHRGGSLDVSICRLFKSQ